MRNPLSWINVVCLAFALSVLPPQTSRAHEWPSRPITLVVPFPPGGLMDFIGRPIADDLAKALGQTVVVQNRPGAGATIGTASVARGAPDGYTLLISAIGPVVIKPMLDKNPIYTSSDLTPVLLIGEAPNVLITKSKHNFKTIDDVVAYAKQNAGKLTVGYPGVGTTGHLLALLLAQETNIQTTLVSYPGAAKLVGDVLGGHIDLASLAYGPSMSSATILAVTADERVSFLPNVPAMKESRFPNVVGSTWFGIFGPAGLPAPIVSKLNKIMNDFLSKEETKRKFATIGFRILGGPPEGLRRRIDGDQEKWAKVIQAANLGPK